LGRKFRPDIHTFPSWSINQQLREQCEEMELQRDGGFWIAKAIGKAQPLRKVATGTDPNLSFFPS
jgi:hypothetical protein